MTNLQGDVVAILDNTGNPVVEYTYDAWGNLLSVTGSLTNTLGADNPLRYRGYVYDTQTRLYYLQSRYYDPEVGRFINADALVSTGQGVLGNNMFAYCRNNSVCRMDASGYGDVDFKETNADEADVAPDEHELGGGGGGTSSQTGPHSDGASNPYGRHGGPAHSGLVSSLRRLFEKMGWDVSSNEKRVPIPDKGRYRYPDLTVNTGMEKIYVQVGRSTKGGNPIAREQQAIDDLGRTGNQVWFFGYDD